jgi:hypothetical protein
MKSNRNRAFLKNVSSHEERSLFPIGPILPNIIAVVVAITAYWYIYTHYLLVDYTTYLYWTMNIIVSYNILAASARSFIAPILAIIAALATYIFISNYGYSYLTTHEFWQLIGLGVAGLIISIIIKL